MKEIKRLICAALAMSISVAVCACENIGGGVLKPKETSLPNQIDDNTIEEHVHVYEKEGYTYMQLIPDITFESGMKIISQKDHANADKTTTVGFHSFYEDKTADSAKWLLAQWDSGPDLKDCLVDKGVTEITDGGARTFRYIPDTDTMTFVQDTSIFYNGNPAKTGDYWPHLLIEQSSFKFKDLSKAEKEYYKCNADKIVLTMDIKLDSYSITEIDGDWVRAEQFLLYFYVKGVKTNDFCWFGVQLFDNRWTLSDNYIGYDGGKADASGAMIFSIGSQYVYPYPSANLWKNGSPSTENGWVHIELDIKPFLEKMLEAGQNDGYFKAKTLSELCINGMNMGWETIGTFNSTMSVRNLRLTSYIKENKDAE